MKTICPYKQRARDRFVFILLVLLILLMMKDNTRANKFGQLSFDNTREYEIGIACDMFGFEESLHVELIVFNGSLKIRVYCMSGCRKQLNQTNLVESINIAHGRPRFGNANRFLLDLNQN